MRKLSWLVIICSLFFACRASSKELVIMGNEGDSDLPIKVLRLALDRADIGYRYYGQNVTVSKLMADINSGDLDIIWQMTSAQAEQDFAPIYFPVYRGTLGMRLAITKRSKAQLFDGVRNLADLKRFKAGQGKGWADTLILEGNGLDVVQSHKYENLFHMLEGERFDYFPRGLFEPWGEVERFADLDLVVEPNIMIHYVAPLYFFVRKGEERLAQTIYQQLEKMTQSGEYERLFFADENVKNSLNLSNLSKRTVIKLDNPSLSQNTPLEKADFWFNPREQK